ncbi:MAG TPA: ATP-binding cassette domain-containing protein [Pyrinomonadaceae bacterium]|nr:ATP-binding cassette domain-containing protein [Pyrinomonadaceae bacterium]HMP66462.1 ATP-binding cassette domain-containing protein [Pyrinomonadaceae bacterium]
MDDPAVEFRGVSYEISGTQVLSGLDLDIAVGEVLVLLGESGCGKTTTLKLINRLIEPTGGEVLVEGKSTSDWDVISLRRRIGYVLQEGGLFPHFTVADNVGIVPALMGWEKERRRLRAFELLKLVGLPPDDFSDRLPHELSGGQRQRVGVARALAADPGILLLDEPFGALDPLRRGALQKEFAELVRELQKTAIFVTHDLHEAMLLASRIALMEQGHIVFHGTPGELRRSDVPLARKYLDTVGVPA